VIFGRISNLTIPFPEAFRKAFPQAFWKHPFGNTLDAHGRRHYHLLVPKGAGIGIPIALADEPPQALHGGFFTSAAWLVFGGLCGASSDAPAQPA
jgi:hypothetical protein